MSERARSSVAAALWSFGVVALAAVAAGGAQGAPPTATALMLEPPAVVWGEFVTSNGSAMPTTVEVRCEPGAGGGAEETAVVRAEVTTSDAGEPFERVMYRALLPAFSPSPSTRDGGKSGASRVSVRLDGTDATPPTTFDNARVLRVDVKDRSQAFAPAEDLLSTEVRIKDKASSGSDLGGVYLRAFARKPSDAGRLRLRWLRMTSDGPQGIATSTPTPSQALHHEETYVAVPDAQKNVGMYSGRWVANLTPLMGSGSSAWNASTTSRTTNAVRLVKRFFSHYGLPSGDPTPAAPTPATTTLANLSASPTLAASRFAAANAVNKNVVRVTGSATSSGDQGPVAVHLVPGAALSVDDTRTVRVSGWAKDGVGVGLLARSALELRLEYTEEGAVKSKTLRLPLAACRTVPLADGSDGGVFWEGESFLGADVALPSPKLVAVDLVLQGKDLSGDYVVTVEELSVVAPVAAEAAY